MHWEEEYHTITIHREEENHTITIHREEEYHTITIDGEAINILLQSSSSYMYEQTFLLNTASRA